jgi:hypothetical protein
MKNAEIIGGCSARSVLGKIGLKNSTEKRRNALYNPSKNAEIIGGYQGKKKEALSPSF